MVIKGDVLDLTDLQRRGLLKKAEEIRKKEESVVKTDNSGYVDFSSWGRSTANSQQAAVTPEPTQTDSSAGSMFGFLDSLASSASSSTSSSESSYGNSYGSTSSDDNLEIQGLKNKIEDLEYKIDRLMEKIAKLEAN